MTTPAKATEGPYQAVKGLPKVVADQIGRLGPLNHSRLDTIQDVNGQIIALVRDRVTIAEKTANARLFAASWSLRNILKKVRRAGNNNPAYFKSDRDTALPYELLAEIEAALALAEPEVEDDTR